MLRIVIDPGVMISAAIEPNGTCADIMRRAAWREFEVVVSPSLLNELQHVLLRPKFRKYLSVDRVQHVVSEVEQIALTRADGALTPGISSDPKDEYLLALALAEDIDYLISGDAHLTTLVTQHVRVITARQLLSILTDVSS